MENEEMTIDEAIQVLDREDKEQDRAIGQLLTSPDKECVILGTELAHLRERWIKIYDDVLQKYIEEEKTKKFEIAAIRALPICTVSLKDYKDGKAWEKEKANIRSRCARDIINKFVETEKLIFKAEDLPQETLREYYNTAIYTIKL